MCAATPHSRVGTFLTFSLANLKALALPLCHLASALAARSRAPLALAALTQAPPSALQLGLPMSSRAAAVASARSTRNAVYGVGLAIVGLGFALLPMAISSNSQANGVNMMTQKEKLGGHQVMRGPFMNTGSSDAGADPSWVRDEKGGLIYVGKVSARARGSWRGACRRQALEGAGGAAPVRSDVVAQRSSQC